MPLLKNGQDCENCFILFLRPVITFSAPTLLERSFTRRFMKGSDVSVMDFGKQDGVNVKKEYVIGFFKKTSVFAERSE